MTQGRYSNIVSTGNGSLFEFFRNRNFFSSLSGLALSIESLQTNLPHLELDFSFPQTDFIVLAPGASTQNRRWPIAKFAALVVEICERGRVEIVVIGSSGEAVLGDKLQAVLHGIKINNLAGKLSLPQSIVLLSKAKMLISNESSPVHMAATTGTPTLCISQGNHFGRWNPYPDSIAPWIKTVYPKWFENQSPEDLAERFHDGSNEDISQITVEEILLEMKGL